MAETRAENSLVNGLENGLTIELLYFDGCPSWRRAWRELGDALEATGIEATVRLRNIAEMPDSALQGFAGSPTLRIDGHDLEGYDGPPVIACRRYEHNDGRGWPAQARLQEALHTAQRGEG